MKLRTLPFLLILLSITLAAQEQDIKFYQGSPSLTAESVPWYSYSSNNISTNIVKFYTDGFRVSLGAANGQDEALLIKRELEFKLGIDLLYIYKDKDKYLLRLGDFIDNGSARLMMFQLQQLGYTKARVIEDKVFVF
ncbi:MAG: hypothetical protein IPJ75_06925 [Ignavibacteriales bacterium]|nr:hypothetical protein [Ignavibacteriales bacterium]